ncbi:hypothetical protein [Phytohabitans aurantiacus]|nr:hypothetical protein [Phytohabitans aurantiacus]
MDDERRVRETKKDGDQASPGSSKINERETADKAAMEPASTKAESGEGDSDKADAEDVGTLTGLMAAVTDESSRRSRNLEALAQEAAFRNLGALAGHQQVAHQYNYIYASPSLSGGERFEPVPPEVLAKVRQRFVRRPGHTVLWRKLVEKAALVIAGPAGYGKAWTALHLLDAMCEGGVRRVGRLADLVQVDDDSLHDQTGYLVEIVAAADAHAIDLESFVGRLRRRRSRVVVVTALDLPALSPGLASFAQELDAPPVAADVLKSQLFAEVGEEHYAAACDVVAKPAVGAVLADLAAERCGLDEVYRLAVRLRPAVLGEVDVETVCAADPSKERFTAWFRALPEAEDQTFAIALAVLNGLPFATVAEAGGLLHSHIQRARRPHKPPRVRAFARTTQDLLAAVRARVAEGREDTGYGEVSARVVLSDLNAYPRRLLQLLWEDYPGLHPILLAWLRELAMGNDARVRASAATAVGMVAALDFYRTYEQVLLGWAGSWRREDRQAAVSALRVPALRPDQAAVIWNLVEDWVDEERPLPLQLTAAAALGGSVGASDTRRALRILEKQADSVSYRLKQTICQAATDLFASSDPAQAYLVLDSVNRWATDRNIERIRTSLATFLQIALDREYTDPETGALWPRLLWRVRDVPAYRGVVAGLWRKAINRPNFDEAAMGVLHHWVCLAERYPHVREPLSVQVAAIPESERDLRSLRFNLRKWSSEPNASPATAHILLNALRAERMRDDAA